MEKSLKIQEPVVAGQFYPADKTELEKMIAGFYAQAPDTPLGDNLIGIVSPHAGYIYSGPVAAYAYKNLPKNIFKTVVIIFPSHYESFRGILALDIDAYRTPLGDVEIDREMTKKLIAADPAIFYRDGLYNKEHSMEVMLPFLQTSLGKSFKVVLLMMGDQTPRMAARLAQILGENFKDGKTLFVASTDMSHYHSYDEAEKIDADTLANIVNLDETGLVGELKIGNAELCGYGPVLTLMQIAKMNGAQNAKLLKHANSGDTAGDKSKVVGYGAIAFFSNKQ